MLIGLIMLPELSHKHATLRWLVGSQCVRSTNDRWAHSASGFMPSSVTQVPPTSVQLRNNANK